MTFWIDRSGSEYQNIIILTDNAVILGSSDKETHDRVEVQLKQNISPIEVLGSDDLMSIPFTQIQSLVSRSTDDNVDLKYKAKKEIEDISLDFESSEESQQFVDLLDNVLPDNLEKTQYQQGVIKASLAPFLSLLFGLSALYLYFNKARIAALVIGGLWILVSLISLYTRVSNPPEITRWSIKGRYVRKTWQGLKTGFTFLVAILAVFSFSMTLPDTHGPANLYQLLENGEELSLTDIDELIEQGGDVNYQQDGYSVLSEALYRENHEISAKLIEAGADVNIPINGINMLEHALDNNANQAVMKLILERINLDKIKLYEMSLPEYVQVLKEDGDTELAGLIETHIK